MVRGRNVVAYSKLLVEMWLRTCNVGCESSALLIKSESSKLDHAAIPLRLSKLVDGLA